MNYWLHSEAAAEHAEQVAFYEARLAGLGRRYHVAFRTAIIAVCAAPDRYRVALAPSIRKAALGEAFHSTSSFAMWAIAFRFLPSPTIVEDQTSA